jgi:hypothetical protein
MLAVFTYGKLTPFLITFIIFHKYILYLINIKFMRYIKLYIKLNRLVIIKI